MKRSGSSLNEGIQRKIAPPLSNSPSFRMPVDKYALMYLDNDDKVVVTGSPSVREQSSAIFTDEMRQTFLKIVKPMVDLRIGDTPGVLAFYESALDDILQVHCCMIIRAFINFIEPTKQARYPYSGKRKKKSTNAIPKSTKPPWWPAGIAHKATDRLAKADRNKLILHIIRMTPFKGINADKLIEVVHFTKRSKPDLSVETICEILRVRKMEENFENGYLNKQEVIRVMNRERKVKSNDEEDSRHYYEQILLAHNTKLASGTIDAHSDPGLRSSISQGDVHFSIPPTGLGYPFHSQNRFVHGDLPLDPQHYCQPYLVSSQPFIPDSNEALQNFPSQMNSATALPGGDQYGRCINSYRFPCYDETWR